MNEINLKKVKHILKRIWKFLIHDNSVWSFIADAIIIIIVGKLILFPLLGLLFGTSLPVVAVVSQSMNHGGLDFDAWWEANHEWYEEREITKEQFEEFDYNNGFREGDALILFGPNKEEINKGDIIVFTSPQGPIIHRVVSVDPLETKGDANSAQIYFEKNIALDRVEGVAVKWIPFIGWPKAILESATNMIR